MSFKSDVDKRCFRIYQQSKIDFLSKPTQRINQRAPIQVLREPSNWPYHEFLCTAHFCANLHTMIYLAKLRLFIRVERIVSFLKKIICWNGFLSIHVVGGAFFGFYSRKFNVFIFMESNQPIALDVNHKKFVFIFVEYLE